MTPRATGSFRVWRNLVHGVERWEVVTRHGSKHGREDYATEDEAIHEASRLNQERRRNLRARDAA